MDRRSDWLTPVIQALWRPRQVNHLRSGVQDQPDQHGETLFKKKKKEKLIFNRLKSLMSYKEKTEKGRKENNNKQARNPGKLI